MNPRLRHGLMAATLLAAALPLLACQPSPPREATRQGGEIAEAPLPRHLREFVFVGSRDGEPLVAPFRFTTLVRPTVHSREVQGWLAHGTEWEAFVSDTFTTSPTGGAWRVLPRGPLRVVAGGPTEVQALVYRRGERLLRLEMQGLVSTWNRDEQTAYRFFSGQLAVGGEVTRGKVLEVQRASLTSDGGRRSYGDLDWLVLSDGGDLHILVAEALGGELSSDRTYAWTLIDGGEGNWEEAASRWVDLRPYEPARRDIPVRWTFTIPGAGVAGEIEARGFVVDLGPERAGRRAVDVRYTVSGWVRVGEQAEERRVFGMVRHTQD